VSEILDALPLPRSREEKEGVSQIISRNENKIEACGSGSLA
jgi:hypothetical protein